MTWYRNGVLLYDYWADSAYQGPGVYRCVLTHHGAIKGVGIVNITRNYNIEPYDEDTEDHMALPQYIDPCSTADRPIVTIDSNGDGIIADDSEEGARQKETEDMERREREEREQQRERERQEKEQQVKEREERERLEKERRRQEEEREEQKGREERERQEQDRERQEREKEERDYHEEPPSIGPTLSPTAVTGKRRRVMQ